MSNSAAKKARGMAGSALGLEPSVGYLAERPVVASGKSAIFYSKRTGEPTFWNGTEWVDYAGAAVDPAFVTNAGTEVNDCTSVSTFSFTGSGASSASLNTDMTYVKTGTTSIKVTSDRGSAGSVTLSTINTFSITDAHARVGHWVYIPDYTLLSGVIVYTYQTYPGTAKYQTYNFNDGDKKFNGWHWISYDLDQYGGTAGTPDFSANPITRVELRPTQVGATAATIYVDSMWIGTRTKPKCIIYMDDGYDSWYTIARPLLAARSLPSTIAVIGSLVGASGYMTEAQMRTMYDEGHDLCVHGATALTTPAFGIAADLDANKGWLTSRGLDRAANHYVYPSGYYQLSAGDQTILDLVRARFATGRSTTTNRPFNHVKGFSDQKYCMPIIGKTAAESAATIITRLGECITRGDSCILMFHRIVASGASGADCNTADLTAILDELQTQVAANAIDVMTVSDWYATTNI